MERILNVSKHTPTDLLRVVIKDGPAFTVPARIGNHQWSASNHFAPPKLTDIIRHVEQETGRANLTGVWVDDRTCIVRDGKAVVALGRRTIA